MKRFITFVFILVFAFLISACSTKTNTGCNTINLGGYTVEGYTDIGEYPEPEWHVGSTTKGLIDFKYIKQWIDETGFSHTEYYKAFWYNGHAYVRNTPLVYGAKECTKFDSEPRVVTKSITPADFGKFGISVCAGLFLILLFGLKKGNSTRMVKNNG